MLSKIKKGPMRTVVPISIPQFPRGDLTLMRGLRKSFSPLLLVLAASLSIGARAQEMKPPEVTDLSKVSFQIVAAKFVSTLEGASGNRFQEPEATMDQYRGLVLTVKITKPAGQELTVVAQDMTLHYRYGDNSDAARCFGLSTFSAAQDDDRAMSLLSQGWGRSTTGTNSTKLSVVYIDLFFQNMEPTTADMYLLVAQPTGAHFTSSGWSKP